MTMSKRNLQTYTSLLAALLVLAGLPAKADKKDEKKETSVMEQLRFKAGDEKGNEIKALKTEILVIKSEKMAMQQLHKLMSKHKGTPMEPDILFRMGELYMRRARSERFFEIHRNSEHVATFAPKLVKEASEAAEIRKAIAIYERIQSEFPRFRSMDMVLFNNAYARQQLGQDKISERLLTDLIKRFPRSPLVPDSYLSIGEINFQRRNFKFALENFQAIRNYPTARVYPYGIYKAAWSYYNLQQTSLGIKELEDVVAFGHSAAQAGLDAKLDLRKEALGDLALFYLDVKPAARAVEYFMAQARELDAVPYIMRLVELYKHHSRMKDVEIVLVGILDKLPNSELIATVHEELIWNYERMHNRTKAVAQMEAFDKMCDNFLARAAKNNRSAASEKASEPAECQIKISETSKKLAMKWHATWKKQGGDDDLSNASVKSYSIYLKSASLKDEDLPKMRFALAELLFARGQFREASSHYAGLEGYATQNVKVEPTLAHDSAYAAIVSLEKATNDKWDKEADERRFVELADSYVRRFPQGKYALDLQFKGAFIAYEKERYDEAAGKFKTIGWMKNPKAQDAEKVTKAQDLYLDILNIKKDFKTLKEAAQSLLGQGVSVGRVTQIEKIYREAYFSEIQQIEEKGDLKAAVQSYKAFARENPKSELAPKAWWNASQLQFRMNDVMGGAETCHDMRRLFPTAPNVKECLTRSAQSYESLARLDLAAKVLLDLAEVESEKQAHWHELAADFFALSGDRSRAIGMYTKLSDSAKERSRKIELLEKSMRVAQDGGDLKTVAAIEKKYHQMGAEPFVSRMVLEQAEAALEKSDLTNAFNLSKRIVGNEGLPKDLLARARFVQAQVLEDEYRRQSVKARVERIGIVLAIKTEKLEKAQKAYQSAIRYGDPETSVKSLRRLANCYIDYAKTVREMTLPDDVPEADQQAFKAEIEQLSIPMEEKGIESMNQALVAARKAQLRDGQIAEIQKEINQLNFKTNAEMPVQILSPVVYIPQFQAGASGVGL